VAEAKKIAGQDKSARAAYLSGCGNGAMMMPCRSHHGIHPWRSGWYDAHTAAQSLRRAMAIQCCAGFTIGANCLGPVFTRAVQPGVPLSADPAQGYAGPSTGIRRGPLTNSQFDSWSGCLQPAEWAGIDREQAREAGYFLASPR